MKNVRYEIICAETAADLEREVNAYLQKDYMLCGNLVIAQYQNGIDRVFYQPMILNY